MQTTALGHLRIGRIGLGAMGMSWGYSGAGSDDAESIRTLHRALDLGVTLLDTAEAYGPHTNEELIGRALAHRREEAVVATKYGILSHTGRGEGVLDSSPASLRVAVEGSLRRLRVDAIDLLYQHRVDPLTPIEDTVGAAAELVAAGKVRHLGLCEVRADTVRRAHAVHPITAVQSEYSLWTRDQDELLPTLRELGIGLVGYSPLGRGLLTGALRSVDDLDESDWRRANPRFAAENIAHNVVAANEVRAVADDVGITPAQVALAWILARGVVPIPGTKHATRLEENIAADTVELTSEQLRRLDDVSPAVGNHHGAAGMSLLER